MTGLAAAQAKGPPPPHGATGLFALSHHDLGIADDTLTPLCPGCISPWRMALRMARDNEELMVALRLSRPLSDQFLPVSQRFDPRWHLGIAAIALTQPGERRVVAGLCRAHRNTHIEASLEAMEADLPPVTEQPRVPKRSVRRTGAVVSWQIRDPSFRPSSSFAAPRPQGVTLGGTVRMWQSPGAHAVLDSQLRLEMGTRMAAAKQPQIWADLGWRGLVGSDDKLLAAGGWRLPSTIGNNHHVLKQDVPGYEDMVRYTARMVHAQVGAGTAVGRSARVDVFAAATQLDTLAHRPARWLRSLGAKINLTPAVRRGRTPLISYQVAHRFDGARGPWLHMLTASI